MDLYEGRPDNCSERENREVAVYDLLDGLGVHYQRVDHEGVMTMEACQEIDRSLGVAMCKNLFLCNKQKTEHYLLLMPADKPFKSKEFSAALGCARLSFAKPEAAEDYLGIKPGAVTVMGLLNDKENRVRLVMDQDIVKSQHIGCHPCVNTSSLKLLTKDLLEKVLPAIHHSYEVVRLIGE